MKPIRLLSVLGIAALAFAVPYSAGATVKKTGSWPGAEKKIDLEFQGKPSDGLKQLAKEAGWSLVVANGVAVDGSGGDVHVEVDDQPADAVLEALFVGRDVVAHRNGTLITVTPATEGQTGATAVPPVVPTPPNVPTPKVGVTPPVVPTFSVDTAPTPPPVPTVRGEDRNVFGSSLVIHKNEIVHTVTVTGGSLKVEGIITGDLVIAGGSAKLQPGARVVGNATVFGGSLKMEKDSRIDGDVGIAGGSLNRDEGSVVGGKIVDNENGQVSVTANEGEISTNVSSHESGSRLSRFGQAAHSFGQSVTRMALLFVLGCVLLALLSPRMERLRVEIASRPMRSFALGLVSTLLGSIGALILLTILCISVIGIPVALFAVLAGVIAIYGAIASVLTTFGAAVIGHRTQNPYLHLLLGCAAFLALSSIPWIGPLVTLAVAMIAIGALIVTRVGGLLERGRTAPPTGLV